MLRWLFDNDVHDKFSRLSAALTLVLGFGGCALVSGLDDFEVVPQNGDGGGSSSSTGSSSASSTGSGGGGGTAAFSTIGGNVVGLAGKGLILKNNGSDDLQIGTNGPFSFPAKVQSGSGYDVSVASSPSGPSQSCVVKNGAGIATGMAVTDVLVTCTTQAYSVGGSVVGLNASGLVLINAGVDDLPIASSGVFTFPTLIPSGSPFDVVVKTQPSSGGPCAVSGGTGVIGNADVNSVIVNCTPGTYTVGGTITGLIGSIVLQQNGGSDLTLTADGSFAFSQTLAPGATYAVTVLTQPAFPPRNQKCTVTNGSGTMGAANITNVSILCVTESYSIGGNATGLSGSLVLANNGADNLTVPQSGAFTFMTPVMSGNVYGVSVVSPPAGQTCTVINGSGTVANGAVNNIEVACSTPVGNPGILCGANYCDPSSMLCCVSNNVPACVAKCTGGGTTSIACDSAADCAGGLVCCGSVSGNTVNAVYCTQASLCTAPKAYFCDPTDPNPCPNGGTCTAAVAPSGYYRCF